jgi:hypothetical protein
VNETAREPPRVRAWIGCALHHGVGAAAGDVCRSRRRRDVGCDRRRSRSTACRAPLHGRFQSEWTIEFASEAGIKATFIETVPDPSDHKLALEGGDLWLLGHPREIRNRGGGHEMWPAPRRSSLCAHSLKRPRSRSSARNRPRHRTASSATVWKLLCSWPPEQYSRQRGKSASLEQRQFCE